MNINDIVTLTQLKEQGWEYQRRFSAQNVTIYQHDTEKIGIRPYKPIDLSYKVVLVRTTKATR